MSRDVHQRWYRLEGRELGQEVKKLADSLNNDYSARDRIALNHVSLYEGRRLETLSASAYGRDWDNVGTEDSNVLRYNLHRSGCDTVHAEIAGRQNPRPMFITSGGDYRQRRKAKRLDKFVEAQLKAPQGMYTSGYALIEDGWLDAEITGTQIIKVFDDADKIVLELVPINQLRVDLDEAAHGDPRNFFQVGPIDIDVALSKFCDGADLDKDDMKPDADEELAAKRFAITSAKPYQDELNRGTAKVSPPIEYVEAWHVPYDSGDDSGRHTIVINGEVMFDETWERPAPFAIGRWARERLGFWGVGLVAEGKSIVCEVNVMAEKLQARHVLCGSKRTYYTVGSLVKGLDEIQQNEHETFIETTAGAELPRETVPTPVGPSEVEHFSGTWSRYFEVTGTSQQAATARKDPGVTAGVAMRTASDLQTRRFAVKAKQYESLCVQVAKLVVEAARAVAEQNAGFELPFPGSDFHEQIKWQDVDLKSDIYNIEVYPISSLPTTPEGRLQMAQEIFQAGAITQQTFLRLLDMPDLENEYETQAAEHERIEWEISRMLDAESAKGFEFHAPDGYILDQAAAMQLCSREYNRAIREGAPKENLELLRAYMRNIEELLNRATEAAAAAAAAAAPPVAPAGIAPIQGGPMPQAVPPQMPMTG